MDGRPNRRNKAAFLNLSGVRSLDGALSFTMLHTSPPIINRLAPTKDKDSLRRRANARNVSFRISLR